MRFGVSLPNFGTGVDAAAVAGWARAAETAGWDGLFLWDHLFAFEPGPVETVDPWIPWAGYSTDLTSATATLRRYADRAEIRLFQVAISCSIGASARDRMMEAAIIAPGPISRWTAR